MFWNQLLFVLVAIMLIWFAIRLVRMNPGAFSMENIHKSVFALGIMALILIGFIALLVIMLGRAH